MSDGRRKQKGATLILRLDPNLRDRIDRAACRAFEARSETARRALEIGLQELERE